MDLCPNVLFRTLCTDLSSVGDVPLNCDPSGAQDVDFSLHRKYIAVQNLRRVFLSKFAHGHTTEADSAALSLMLQFNEACRNWAPPTPENDLDALLLGEFESQFKTLTDDAVEGESYYDRDLIFSNMNVGPGASVGVDGTSYYEKVASSRMTCTDVSLYEYYSYGVSCSRLEADTEGCRSSLFGDCEIVEGSKLSFAPKKREISRVICTEPSLNLMLQKGLGACIELVLERHFGVSLDLQPERNRQLAWLGSWSGLYATLDSRSFSDLISVGFCNRYMGRKLLRLVMKFRSPKCRLPDGSLLDLHMIGTMGNGFTFPLQTLIGACVIRTAYVVAGLPLKRATCYTPGNFGVFGDDIVVETKTYDLVVRLLTLLGHQVNTDKSFASGPFRESCGGDFVTGYDVRGVYMKHPLRAPQEYYKLHNRLLTWSLRHDVPLPRTLKLLRCCTDVLFVPPYENEDAGFRMTSSQLDHLSMFPRDANGSTLYYGLSPRVEGLWIRHTRGFFVSPAERRRIRVAKRRGKPRHATAHPWNNEGVLLAAVRGYLRDGHLPARSVVTRYKKSMRVSPGWDWHHGLLDGSFPQDAWCRWVTDGWRYHAVVY